MYLIDTNIIIYSANPQHAFLKKWVNDRKNAFSAITRLETVGFHGLKPVHEKYFQSVFSQLKNCPIDGTVINAAITIRKQKNIKAADAIIAATALLYNLELVTRNTKDFKNIPGLTVVNPFP